MRFAPVGQARQPLGVVLKHSAQDTSHLAQIGLPTTYVYPDMQRHYLDMLVLSIRNELL